MNRGIPGNEVDAGKYRTQKCSRRLDMPIADSRAVLLPGRVLPQHQTAVSLVKVMTQDPLIKRIRWLDLACGRGQIFACFITKVA